MRIMPFLNEKTCPKFFGAGNKSCFEYWKAIIFYYHQHLSSGPRTGEALCAGHREDLRL